MPFGVTRGMSASARRSALNGPSPSRDPTHCADVERPATGRSSVAAISHEHQHDEREATATARAKLLNR